MKDKYDPLAESPDDIFREEMNEMNYDEQNKNRNTITISKWAYYWQIPAQLICYGFGIGTGMMLKERMMLEETASDVHLEKPVHVEKKDVNDDGIDDLIFISKESKEYNIFIGRKDKSYVDIDQYYREKGKEADQKVDSEKDSIEEKVKQELRK